MINQIKEWKNEFIVAALFDDVRCLVGLHDKYSVPYGGLKSPRMIDKCKRPFCDYSRSRFCTHDELNLYAAKLYEQTFEAGRP